MARFYVEHNGEWNIFSTIVDDFLFDEFVCIDALKARLLYERFKELTEDIDSLMTDKPKVNVMPYEEAVRIADRKTENSSEKPNNCEHITEDGVTCAKYPACDDCLDNPLNKVKGSERLVKSSEQTEPTISKMEQVDKDINVRSKDEPQTESTGSPIGDYRDGVGAWQTDCDDRYAIRTDSGEVVAYACPLGCEQTDCGWK